MISRRIPRKLGVTLAVIGLALAVACGSDAAVKRESVVVPTASQNATTQNIDAPTLEGVSTPEGDSSQTPTGGTSVLAAGG